MSETKPIPEAAGTGFFTHAQAMQENAPEFLLQLAETHGEIVAFRLFGQRFLLLSSPELAREVLVGQAANFPKAKRDVAILSRFLGQGLVTNNDAAFHAQQRKLAQPAFHMRRIRGYAEVMVDYTERLIATWQPGAARDIAEEMMELTMFIVAKSLYDVDMGTMAAQARRIGAAIAVLQAASNEDYTSFFVWPEWLPTARNRRRKAARAILYDTIEKIIAERRATAVAGEIPDTGDLLSMLLRAQYDDGTAMSDQQLRDEMVTLFAAGHETTSNALTWTWHLLAQHPDVEARLHDELHTVLNGRPPTLEDLPALPYTLQIVKEAMRLYPPAWALNARQAAAATTIGGYAVPAGAILFIAPYVQHRLSRYWERPSTFDPDRWTPEKEKALPRYLYLPFGAGPRVCIGNSFALMEAHLIVATIAQRFRLVQEPAQAIRLNPLITLSNETGMWMRPIPRTASAAESVSADGRRQPAERPLAGAGAAGG